MTDNSTENVTKMMAGVPTSVNDLMITPIDSKFVHVKLMDGTCIGQYGMSVYLEHSTLGIGSLEVYPAYRNKGYGTKIITDIIEKAKTLGFKLVYCFVDADNPDAQRFYSRIGEVSDHMNEAGRYQVTLYRSAGACPALLNGTIHPVNAGPATPKSTSAPTSPAATINPPKATSFSVSNNTSWMHPIKNMDFPKRDWSWLFGQNEITTRRFGKEFNQYLVGDVVTVPWNNDKYCVVESTTVQAQDVYPYLGKLSKKQFNDLMQCGWVNELKLHRLCDTTMNQVDEEQAKKDHMNRKQLVDEYLNTDVDKLYKQIYDVLDEIINDGDTGSGKRDCGGMVSMKDNDANK